VQLYESLSKSLCVAASFAQPCWVFDAVFDAVLDALLLDALLLDALLLDALFNALFNPLSQAHSRHAAALIDINRKAKILMLLKTNNTITPHAG